ncbi:MAG: aspartate kinase, partial [Planctomycetaceae bacterium]
SSPPPREMDMLLSTGEQESVALMAMAVQQLGVDAISLTGGQMGVRTDSSHTKARILSISTDRIRAALNAGKIVIAAGFQGVDADADITTLGRGGSDTTAAALAAVLQADECQVYTDVEGVFTTDPRIVAGARKIDTVACDEMLELASLGAGVMHSRSIEFAKKYRVPIRVRSSRSDGQGTLIVPQAVEGLPPVSGVALVRDEVRVSFYGLPDRPGVMSLVFSRMSQRKIPVDMIVQNVGLGQLADVSFTVPQDDLAETLTAAEHAVVELEAGTVCHGTHLSKVSVVGCGMRTHSGVAAQMFRALASANINVGMVTTSEIKISVLVDRNDCDSAVDAVHAAFQLQSADGGVPSVGQGTQVRQPPPGGTRQEIEQAVVDQLASMEDIVVSEVQLDSNQARVTIRDLPDAPGILAQVFSVVAEGGVMVDMIVQNAAQDGLAQLSFSVPQVDLDRCLALVESVLKSWPGTKVSSDADIAKLSVMGIGLRSHTGVASRMFAALADEGINVQMINTSEIRISAVVADRFGRKALMRLLQVFGLDARHGVDVAQESLTS